MGFFRTSNCFRYAIADTQINGLGPADLAPIKYHGHFRWCSDIVIETPVATKSFAIYEKSIVAVLQPGAGRTAGRSKAGLRAHRPIDVAIIWRDRRPFGARMHVEDWVNSIESREFRAGRRPPPPL